MWSIQILIYIALSNFQGGVHIRQEGPLLGINSNIDKIRSPSENMIPRAKANMKATKRPYMSSRPITAAHASSGPMRRGRASTGPGTPEEDDQYLGYSIAVGDFTGNGQTDIAVGAPKALSYLGKVR